jgi:hypothetical protein
MVDISAALEAKSDQLNAVDLIGAEKTLVITQVDNPGGEQPVWVHYEGGKGKPWKPSKGMLRVLSFGWGTESDNWIGKSVQVFCEPTVMYAGKEVGGIQILAMSDIPEKGLNCVLAKSRTSRTQYHVKHLKHEVTYYPDEKFVKALPAMKKAISDGAMTLQEVISRCEKTGKLTPDQIRRIEHGEASDDNGGNTVR